MYTCFFFDEIQIKCEESVKQIGGDVDGMEKWKRKKEKYKKVVGIEVFFHSV